MGCLEGPFRLLLICFGRGVLVGGGRGGVGLAGGGVGHVGQAGVWKGQRWRFVRGFGQFGIGGWQVGWVGGEWVGAGAGGLDAALNCVRIFLQRLHELHGEKIGSKISSKSVQNRFKISSKSPH